MIFLLAIFTLMPMNCAHMSWRMEIIARLYKRRFWGLISVTIFYSVYSLSSNLLLVGYVALSICKDFRCNEARERHSANFINYDRYCGIGYGLWVSKKAKMSHIKS